MGNMIKIEQIFPAGARWGKQKATDVSVAFKTAGEGSVIPDLYSGSVLWFELFIFVNNFILGLAFIVLAQLLT